MHSGAPRSTQNYPANTRDALKSTQKHPGGTQQQPGGTKEHPGGTQEPQSHPGDNQETPRKHPGDTQETPRRDPGDTQRHQGLQRPCSAKCAKTMKFYYKHERGYLFRTRRQHAPLPQPAHRNESTQPRTERVRKQGPFDTTP